MFQYLFSRVYYIIREEQIVRDNVVYIMHVLHRVELLVKTWKTQCTSIIRTNIIALYIIDFKFD